MCSWCLVSSQTSMHMQLYYTANDQHILRLAGVTYKVPSWQHLNGNFCRRHCPDVQSLDDHAKCAMAKLSDLYFAHMCVSLTA